MASVNLFDHVGRPIRLGQKLGTGGEGTVFEIATASERVAKIYHKLPLPARTAAKLRAMVDLARGEITQVAAWPIATLHERPGGPTVGLVMRRIKDFKEIHTLYSPAHRKIAFPKADWKFLIGTAMNCAAALENMHSCGVVIGDVNQSNVLVSTTGLIAFIDCDSFQIQANGQTYPCEVGVPLFTPPELQGQNFRGLIRTPNHDRFGLAVLIFHLLFMGRHPFSGRFLGSGEMPIEQAIREYRFAYGRSARNYQMQTPMHALPLSAVSPPLVDLFERAFSREASRGNTRPTGDEWHDALKGFLQSLRPCPADQGHVYASHLPSCSWCNLMKQGAPNFFISVAFFKVGSSRPRLVFDLATVWARIEEVRFPNLTYQSPVVPQSSCPNPLPPGIPRMTPPKPTFASFSPPAIPDNTLQKTVGIVAVVSGLIFALFLFCVKPIAATAFLAFTVFGVWWIVLEMMQRAAVMRQFAAELQRWNQAIAPMRAEAEKRRRANADAEKCFQAAKATWLARASWYGDRFEMKKAELREMRERYDTLAREYTAEKQNLQSKAREIQLTQFLQRQFISNADIPDIGPTRKATLASFGIETAFDVKENAILQVPGFGPKLTARLIRWRERIKSQFIFKPEVPLQEQQILDLKFAQARQHIEMKLLAGEGELQAIAKQAESELRELYKPIQDCLQSLVQTQLDLKVLPPDI